MWASPAEVGGRRQQQHPSDVLVSSSNACFNTTVLIMSLVMEIKWLHECMVITIYTGCCQFRPQPTFGCYFEKGLKGGLAYMMAHSLDEN